MIKLDIKNKVIYFYIGLVSRLLILQSCNSVTADRLNLKAVTKQDLVSLLKNNQDINRNINNLSRERYADGRYTNAGKNTFKELESLFAHSSIFGIELEKKIKDLTINGFIDNPNRSNNHIDVKKQLMFVFFHSLRFKQSNMSMVDRVNFFNTDQDALNLMYNAVLINSNGNDVPVDNEGRVLQVDNDGNDVRRNNHKRIEFRLNHLFAENDPRRLQNIKSICKGKSPDLKYRSNYRSNFLLILDQERHYNVNLEKIHIDHLLKDNNITIEIPAPLHVEKTKFIDILMRPPQESKQRDSKSYWKRIARIIGATQRIEEIEAQR